MRLWLFFLSLIQFGGQMKIFYIAILFQSGIIRAFIRLWLLPKTRAR